MKHVASFKHPARRATTEQVFLNSWTANIPVSSAYATATLLRLYLDAQRLYL